MPAKPMTTAQSESFARKYLQSEAKSNPAFSNLFRKQRAHVEQIATKMFAEAETVSPLRSKAARKAFVADFLDREAEAQGGGIWVQVIFAMLLPILQKLFESWFQQKEPA